MAKKDFTSGKIKGLKSVSDENKAKTEISVVSIPPQITNVKFPKHAQSIRNFDFVQFYGKGCDEVVYHIQKTIEYLVKTSVATKGQSLSIATIQGYCSGGLIYFFPFCRIMSSALKRDLTLSDINKNLIVRFISYLEQSDQKSTSQKNAYSKVKSILIATGKRGFLNENYLPFFPKNPYPSNHRKSKGERPFSSPEMSSLTQALKKELKRISKETDPLSGYDLTVCLLALAARTGINLTPLVELPVDCLQDHPLKYDRRLLVSFKRRGKATHVASVRKTEEVTLFNTVMMDVASIIDMVVMRNSQVRAKLKSTRLFAYGPFSKGTSLAVSTVNRMTKDIIKNHDLKNDDGKALAVNVSRLRKTFVNRIWALSGQDPIITAAMGGHSLKVSNDYYLEAPPEAEKNFSLLGEIRVKELLDDTATLSFENTPVAQCKDSKYGHLAPKNGEHCTSFLACFRCKSFVVTEEDLYRLFSLYWLLVKERSTIGAKHWGRYYAHIIRIIDNDISPKYEHAIVTAVRKKAHDTPHPYWRANNVLEEEVA
jgi:Phage integrase SAM-like domain